MSGGVSVAERARLFGPQITVSSASKNPKPQQQSSINNQPKKSNIVHQERNYQPFKTDVDRQQRQEKS